MTDYKIFFRNDEDYGNEVFNRKNVPIPKVDETVCLINPNIQRRFKVVKVEYNYYTRNEEYFSIDVYVKEIKE